jgi:hypothetical protein
MHGPFSSSYAINIIPGENKKGTLAELHPTQITSMDQ